MGGAAMMAGELTIPRSWGESVWAGFLSLIVVVFALLALWNLANFVAVIPSILWLVIIGYSLWDGCREAGGIRRYLVDWVGALAGRRFVVFPGEDVHRPCIRFGYELWGHRFYQEDIEVERIESVEWSPGQASQMARRDMKDWHVALWYDHRDPERSRRQRRLRKPDQAVSIVGPSRCREKTAALGRDVVSFLRGVGVHLVEGSADTVFTRQR